MIASTGMATFHQVMTALTLLNRRMPKKFTAVMIARSAIVMIAPAPIHAQIAAGPRYVAAKYEPNSQPEPMIEVSDAHMAPINPISRFRPTSTGLVDTAEVSVAMIEPSFRSTNKKLTPASRPHGNDHQGA